MNDLKNKLHSIIDSTDNEILLEDLLLEAESRLTATHLNEKEGLSEEDFTELNELSKQPFYKDTINYNELKASLSRWFTR